MTGDELGCLFKRYSTSGQSVYPKEQGQESRDENIHWSVTFTSWPPFKPLRMPSLYSCPLQNLKRNCLYQWILNPAPWSYFLSYFQCLSTLPIKTEKQNERDSSYSSESEVFLVVTKYWGLGIGGANMSEWVKFSTRIHHVPAISISQCMPQRNTWVGKGTHRIKIITALFREEGSWRNPGYSWLGKRTSKTSWVCNEMLNNSQTLWAGYMSRNVDEP